MTMNDPAYQPPRSGSRRLRVALIISVTLNLLILGVVAGAIVAGPKGLRPSPSLHFGEGPLGLAMTDEDRKEVRDRLRQSQDIRDLARQTRGRGFDSVVSALTAVPFDPKALDAALAAQRGRGEALSEAAQGAVLAQIAAMTDAERAALAERMQQHRRPGRPGN